MKDSMYVIKKSKLLLITNISSLGLLSALVIKEGYIKRAYTHTFEKEKVESFSYSLNPKFIEQVDYCSIYKKQANIVMFGNSLTYRMNWSELMGRDDIANRGVGSDITTGFIARLNFVFAVNPKICFIEGGINDLDRNIQPKEILDNIETILTKLKEKKIIPVITLILHVTKDYPNSLVINKKIVSLNKQLVDLALKKGAPLLDLNNSLSIDNYLNKDFAENDGIHLTSKAYLIWKGEIEKILIAFNI